MAKQYDVVIIGAGIIGACIAFELSKRGHKTLNVDKLGAAGAGSTANTCAIIRTHYSTLEGTAMAYESYLHWKEWADYLGTADERGLAVFHDTGFLVLLGENRDLSSILEFHEQLGIPFEEWDVDMLKEKEPFFDLTAYYPPRRPDDEAFGETDGRRLTGAVFFPSGGYINDPQLSVHNVQRAAEAEGGEFRFHTEVTGICQKDGRVTAVELAGGEHIVAPIVVNAAGPHSFVVNRMAGIEGSMKIGTRALRHEVHFVPQPEGYDERVHGHVTSDDDIAGYSRPETGNLFLVGSQDPECDPQEWVEDPDNYNREITDEQWKAQVYRMAQRIPGLSVAGQGKGVVDLYDVSDDWIPIYDKSDLGGFYLAIGTSGNQYKNGPMAGLLMADLIEACERGHDHDSQPVKITCPKIGVVMDTSCYSRNREINKDSSFSVLG